MLEAKRIEDIRARAAKATPGPWLDDEGHLRSEGYNHIEHSPIVNFQTDSLLSQNGMMAHEEDANFISHAREDVPDLLAERTELLADIQVLRKRVSQLYRSACSQANEESDE